MEKKFFKYGSKMALIIDKPILEILNITENTLLKIRTDGVKIVIEPVQKMTEAERDKLFKKNIKKIMEKYAEDLEKMKD